MKKDDFLPIILASTSPRRHELLNQVQIEHEILSVQIDETQFLNESPIAYIERMVATKAEQALKLLPKNEQSLIITADTIGVLAKGEVLQKPKDFADACQMWQKMSGNLHQVWTAVQVSRVAVKDDNLIMIWHQCEVVKTDVQFIELSLQMMSDYWATGEPVDKAGAYAIQGLGASWVKAIFGSYSNVVGLPLVETINLLQQAKQM